MAESDPRADLVEWTKPILLLAGPTASGKSRLALELAQRRDAVILNADSQQLYADLRVLTARPSVADEAMAEHRLYGVADAADAWSVGHWLRAAMVEIDALRAKDRPVIVVGGTGLYFRALTVGLADIPPIPEAIRLQTQDLFDALGETVFRSRLQVLDPAAVQRIAAGDRQRLIRAHAVAMATGRPLSSWRADTQATLLDGDYNTAVLSPHRETLYAGCDARSRLMLEGGAVTEVGSLLSRRLSPALPAMKAVGVREIAAMIDGQADSATTLTALAQATRRYAKRQMTWFRNQTPTWRRV